MLNSRYPVLPEQVTSYRLSLVAYNGSGKYINNSLLHYDEIPDNLACEVARLTEMQAEGKLDAKEDAAALAEKALMPPPGEGGWWPVVTLELTRTSKVQLGLTAQDDLLICFYQLISEGELVCWKRTRW
jgi:hypothetical protein